MHLHSWTPPITSFSEGLVGAATCFAYVKGLRSDFDRLGPAVWLAGGRSGLTI
jgi:hypothetical protein